MSPDRSGTADDTGRKDTTMAITKEQAITEREFHDGCRCTVGPKGGIKHTPSVWRRNGSTQTWKTRPEDFRIPVKYGMYDYGQITQNEAHLVFTESDCPVCAAVNAYYRDHRDIDRLRAELASA
jgi:hypothetical protein